MKRTVLILSIVAALVLGGACVLLVRQLSATKESQRAALVSAEAEAAARASHEQRLAEAERDRLRVEKQNDELSELAKTLRQSEAKQTSNVVALAKRLNATGTNDGGAEASPGGKGMGEMLQKMMKDPAMKEMLRSQQKGLMKTMYGPMFKDLNLPADQQKQLTDLLLDAQMSGMDGASGLFGGDGAERTNAINAIAEKQKATTEQVKALLGDEKYAQYEDYQKSMADRMILNQFQTQAAGTETALRDDQLKQLVQLMKEERAKVPPVISEDQGKTAESITKLMNQETMDQQFKWQEDFYKRVRDRAGQVLSPEQLQEFTDFQDQQMNMQKVGLKMAREMFGGGTGAGGNPNPSPPAPAPVK